MSCTGTMRRLCLISGTAGISAGTGGPRTGAGAEPSSRDLAAVAVPDPIMPSRNFELEPMTVTYCIARETATKNSLRSSP